MKRLLLAGFGFLLLANVAFAAKAPVGPSSPAKISLAEIFSPAQKPLFLTQFPTCAPGYGMADDECVACGTPRWPGYQGCITCVNLAIDDQYSTCGPCDTINDCIAP